MKKKLLIFILVLGMTSMVSATMTLWVADGEAKGVPPGPEDYYEAVSSEIVLFPSDYLWIGVYNDTDYTQVPGTGQGTWYLAFMDTEDGEWTGNWVQYIPPLVPGAEDNEYYGVVSGMDLWVLDFDTGDPEQFMGVGVLDAKEFHCTGPESEVEVVLLDESLTVIDSFIIHQVPEPATIALLGLGGLLLRRRK